MSQKNSQKFGAVLVFGDLGRSPRMQNHALEITKQTDYNVYLLGYLENQPHEKIRVNPRIEIVSLQSKIIDQLKKLPRIFYLFYALMRIYIQILQLFWAFFFTLTPKPDFVIIQNPPSIPVLSTMYIICKIRGIKYLVDFHNYGFTILGMNIRNKYILKLATKYEQFFGSRCDYGFCVSNQMKLDLKENWGVETDVLYDKAQTDIFKPLLMDEKHEIFKKLGLVEKQENQISKNLDETLFTYVDENTQVVQYKKNRPYLLVSSTSWTKDEDFQILVDALLQYEKNARSNSGKQYPNLHLIITGKGPQKAYFEQYFKDHSFEWTHIQMQTIWLEAEDYPKLLGAADLGICLHYSSSGLDLPMKVVDMYGAGLPVFAIQYQTIYELVTNDYNGQIFENSVDLHMKIEKLFINWETSLQVLETYRRNINKFRRRTFEVEWKEVVLPVIKKISQKQKMK